MYLSEAISEEEIQSWENKIVFISAKTGAGKSFFCINTLGNKARKYNKKVLILTHRVRCKEQFQKDIADSGLNNFVDVTTYQNLEEIIMKQKALNGRSFYKYVISDEAQYFIDDAEFNERTILSLNFLMNMIDSTVIFLSATPEPIKSIICKKCNEYNREMDFKLIEGSGFKRDFSFAKVKFFSSGRDASNIISHLIERGDKGIVFADSKEKCMSVYEEFKSYSTFCCASSNKEYSDMCDDEEIKFIISSKEIPKQLLITTTCLDAGISIWDDKVTTIILDIFNTNTLVQCIGRKRLKPGEKIFIFIKIPPVNAFIGRRNLLDSNLKKVQEIVKKDRLEWISEYRKEFGRINFNRYFYTDRFNSHKINDVMIAKDINTINTINSCLTMGYPEFICECVLYKEYDYLTDIVYISFHNELNNFIKTHMNIPLSKEDKELLIKYCNLRNKRGRLYRGFNKIDQYLQLNWLCKLTIKRDKRNSRDCFKWMIIKK